LGFDGYSHSGEVKKLACQVDVCVGGFIPQVLQSFDLPHQTEHPAINKRATHDKPREKISANSKGLNPALHIEEMYVASPRAAMAIAKRMVSCF
jgi:hypothetical protein